MQSPKNVNLKKDIQESQRAGHNSALNNSTLTPRKLKPIPYLQEISSNFKLLESPKSLETHYISLQKPQNQTSYASQSFLPKEKNSGDNSKGFDTSTASRPEDRTGADTSMKVNLPDLHKNFHYKSFMSNNVTLRTECSDDISPSFQSRNIAWNLSYSDYVKQEEFLNTSPHFSKFSKISSMLQKIDAKKSSLSKELFYYPEQLEVYNKLKEQSRKNLNLYQEDNETGIINIKENTRNEVNLLEGRNAYFKLNCRNKHFPLKVRVDVFTGSFEIRVSKTKKKPNPDKYDFLFSVENFEVNYEDPRDIKYLYFGVNAVERLRINFIVSFKQDTKTKKISLPPMTYDRERPRKKNKVYEFFSENMRHEEAEYLKHLANEIKRERLQKALSLNNNMNIKQINQDIAAKYDTVRSEQLINSILKREARLKINKQSREFQIQEKYKKYLCETFKSDIRKLKIGWAEEMKKLEMFQKTSLVTITLCFLCQRLKERATVKYILSRYNKIKALRVVKLIKKRIDLKVRGIQKFVRNWLNRPIKIHQIRSNKPFNHSDSKYALNIHSALNAWAAITMPLMKRKAGAVVNKLCEDLLTPILIVDAVAKYNDKVMAIQEKWKSKQQIDKARLDLFIIYWQKYCLILIDEEKNKLKKQTTEIIKKISDLSIKRNKIREIGRKYLQDKTRAVMKAASAFITLQKVSLPKKRLDSVKDDSQVVAENIYKNTSVPLENMAPRSSVTNNKEQKDLEDDEARPKLKFKLSIEEFRIIFDEIVKELKAENKI